MIKYYDVLLCITNSKNTKKYDAQNVPKLQCSNRNEKERMSERKRKGE